MKVKNAILYVMLFNIVWWGITAIVYYKRHLEIGGMFYRYPTDLSTIVAVSALAWFWASLFFYAYINRELGVKKEEEK